ncbi:MAG: hypothetical protein KF745_05120 [Phycisphaeraceae bacterium]|nr:hypothetical protein [Phycisphaeraceae bacterium]
MGVPDQAPLTLAEAKERLLATGDQRGTPFPALRGSSAMVAVGAAAIGGIILGRIAGRRGTYGLVRRMVTSPAVLAVAVPIVRSVVSSIRDAVNEPR